MHHLRHTTASLMVAAEVDVKKVKRQIGHATSQFLLDVYAKYSRVMIQSLRY